MLLALHTPGLPVEPLRAPLEALGAQFLDYGEGDWLEQIAALPVERFQLFGHGLGGLLARAFAAAHPERVERLILCSTAPSLEWLGPRLSQVQRAIAEIDEDGFAGLCRDVLPAAFANPLQTMHEGFDGFDRKLFLRALTLRESSAPPMETLIVHGRYDRLMWLEEGGQRLLQQTRGSELITMEKSGHFPFLEQTGPFVMVVDEFLRGQSLQLNAC